MPRICRDLASKSQLMNFVPVELLEFPYLLLKGPGLNNKLHDHPVNHHFRFLLCPFTVFLTKNETHWTAVGLLSGARAQHTFLQSQCWPSQRLKCSCFPSSNGHTTLFRLVRLVSSPTPRPIPHSVLLNEPFVFLAYSGLYPLSTSMPPSLLGATH